MFQSKNGNLKVSESDFKKEEELRVICLHYNEFNIENHLKIIENSTGFKTE